MFVLTISLALFALVLYRSHLGLALTCNSVVFSLSLCVSLSLRLCVRVCLLLTCLFKRTHTYRHTISKRCRVCTLYFTWREREGTKKTPQQQQGKMKICSISFLKCSVVLLELFLLVNLQLIRCATVDRKVNIHSLIYSMVYLIFSLPFIYHRETT